MTIYYPFGRLMRNGMLFCSIFLSPLATKLFLDLAPGDDSSKTKLKLAKTSIIDLDFVGYNQWLYVMRNNGSLFYDAPDADGNANNAGGEFPRGSAHYAVFAAGLHVGTKKNGIPVVSETEYSTEFQPGRITNSNVAFSSLTAEDPSSVERQVYLIDQTLSGSDYTNWPIDAPRNPLGNPSVIGLARTWVVFNDLDISLSQEGQSVSPDPGLGLQIEESSYAFGGPALQNCVLVRFRITNKTNTSYDSTYFGFWSDPDLGNASNDLVGTDTSRGMAYCYNSAAEGTPQQYAVGYRLLYCTDAGGMNARLVSSTSYINGTDPVDNEERLFMLRGETTTGGNRANGKFDFPGDPVASSGVLDPAGADKRVLLSVGPIQLTPGSSQDLVFAIIGGQADTPLNAILNLRAVSDSIKTAFADSIESQLTMAGELLSNQPPVQVTVLGDTTLNQNFSRTFIAYLPAVFFDPDDSVLTYSDSALSSGVSADVSNDSLYVSSTTGFLGQVLIRVSATDGGATATDTFRVTVIDNVAPVLTHGILASEVVDRVRIVVTANEAINIPTVSVNSQSVTMTKTGDAYFNNYTLNATGDMSLNISVTDMGGNPASASATYHVTLLGKRTSFGRFAFTSASQAGYLVLSDRTIENSPEGWTPLGLAVGLTVTSRTSIQASSSYEAIPDVDERKIGMYEWTGDVWTYAGGQGRDGHVSAAISGQYSVAVFYNPDHVVLPERFALLANYPNPFNPVTSIRYELPITTRVILKVYNILGQEVRTLVRSVESAGFKEVQWDGRDASGQAVASGVYIYRIEAGQFVTSRKMLLIK